MLFTVERYRANSDQTEDKYFIIEWCLLKSKRQYLKNNELYDSLDFVDFNLTDMKQRV
jgi:hypothetical protein